MDKNQSKDVEGPGLKRPENIQLQVKESEHMAKVLQCFDKDDLHEGHIESPLKAAGQSHVANGKMGMSKGMRMPMAKGMGRSVSKKLMYQEKQKLKGE